MKTFYHLLANTLVSSVTNFTVWFAVTFFVFLETRSVLATGIISGVYLVVTFFTGIWFGSVVDHHKKKNVMILSSLISLSAYGTGFILYQFAGRDAFNSVTSPALWIFVVVVLTGVIAGNLRGIALPVMITFLVPEKRRDRANGMAGTASGISFLVTSVISGILVGSSGMFLVLILAAAATFLAVIHLFFMAIKETGIVPGGNESRSIDIRGTVGTVRRIPGLMPLIFFSAFNNFLGGVFMALMDAYGLSLVSVQIWGLLWGLLSTGFIIGGLVIGKFGLGSNPVRSLFRANVVIWIVSSLFTVKPWLWLLSLGMFIYLCAMPFIEASEQTILQKVVPEERQGRVFGFAQSVEQMASPFTAFLIGPLTQFVFIPFMTSGQGARLLGGWFGTGSARGIAFVFTLTGLIGLMMTLYAMNSKYARQLSDSYAK